MQTWAFPAVIEKHGEDDYVATFPDIPEAITGGGSAAEARLNAADALEEAVLAYLAAGRPVPSPREAQTGEEPIAMDPVTASRAVLAEAMREQKVSNVALAKTLGKSEGAIRRLTDGQTEVKIDTVLKALAALGRRTALADLR
jgi:antitoxin HicB